MFPSTHSVLDREQPFLATAVQLGDPSITLIENGPALGVLIAEGCHQDSFTGRLFLDQVTWARRDETVRALRDFAEVAVSRTNEGVWFAEETSTGRLFPQPSVLAYHTLFLDAADYGHLHQWRRAGDIKSLFMFVKYRYRRVPGFHVRNEQLVSPPGFAAAHAAIATQRGYVPDGQ